MKKLKQFVNEYFILILVWIVSIAISAFVVSRVYMIYHNTIYNNGCWVSTKTTLGKGVMAAFKYIASKQSLARCRLNLGAWHGFQEVIYRDKVNPEEIEFDFMLFAQRITAVFLFDKITEILAGKGESYLSFHSHPECKRWIFYD